LLFRDACSDLSGPASSPKPRSPALAIPLGVARRFRVSKKDIVAACMACRSPACALRLRATLPGFPLSNSVACACAQTTSPRACLRSPSGPPLTSPCPSCDERSLLGFRAVRRIRSEGVYPPRDRPPRVLFRAQGVSPSRGFLLLRPRGSISPRYRPSACPFREFPAQPAAYTHRVRFAVLPFERLHGFAPTGRPYQDRCN